MDGPIDSNDPDVTESGTDDCRALRQPERPLAWRLSGLQVGELLGPPGEGTLWGGGGSRGDS